MASVELPDETMRQWLSDRTRVDSVCVLADNGDGTVQIVVKVPAPLDGQKPPLPARLELTVNRSALPADTPRCPEATSNVCVLSDNGDGTVRVRIVTPAFPDGLEVDVEKSKVPPGTPACPKKMS